MERSEEEMEGRDGTCEVTGDTTMLVQIEEVQYAIHKLPFVTVLAPVRAVGDKGRGCQVSLSCYGCQEYGSCPKKQDPAVRLSCEHRTELTCLKELLKRLQDRHVEYAQTVAKKAAADAASAAGVSPDAPNVLQVMIQLDQAKKSLKSSKQGCFARGGAKGFC